MLMKADVLTEEEFLVVVLQNGTPITIDNLEYCGVILSIVVGATRLYVPTERIHCIIYDTEHFIIIEHDNYSKLYQIYRSTHYNPVHHGYFKFMRKYFSEEYPCSPLVHMDIHR